MLKIHPRMKKRRTDTAPDDTVANTTYPISDDAATNALDANLNDANANVADAVKAIETFADDAVMQDWEFRDGGNVMFTLPRAGAFRTWVLSHSIHHRAILSVYFRQLGVKVPSIYGPSSDEGM